MRQFGIILCLICGLNLSLSVAAQAASADPDGYLPTRYGLALLVGNAYDPQNIGLAMVQGQMLLDYDRIFAHAAPAALRLKIETNLGISTDGRRRALLGVNLLALLYLENFSISRWTPYVEAGIGLIYTDFRVAGQGLHLNFNPQAGAGLMYALPGGGALTTALRLHHISNANLYPENRGINSALLLLGYLF